MAWSTSDIPDLAGRIAVVTGASGGLGLETCRALAVAGCHVVMASRNQDKAADAAKDILGAAPGASLESVPLDLGSLKSIETASVTILATHNVVDLLMNNAGLMAMPEGRTNDGFETQLGVNHLGHWALTPNCFPLFSVPTRDVW